MPELLMLVVIVAFVVGAVFCFFVPLVRAWKRQEWGWVVAIILLGWIGGAIYLLTHYEQPHQVS